MPSNRNERTHEMAKRDMYRAEQRRAVAASWTGKGLGTRAVALTLPDGRVRNWRLVPLANGTVRAERVEGTR
jgi:hypothetical protein